jgi:uncharacterized protein (DUF58 family)
VLTRHGWGALLLAIATAIIGRMFGVLELFVLGAGIVALVFATMLWIGTRRISLEVRRRVIPEALQVGDVGRVELRIANRRRSNTSPLQLWEPVSGMGGATLRLAPLHGGETVAANYRLPATRRGTVVFGPLQAERRDPFGLVAQRRTIAGTEEVVVLPAHIGIALPSGNGGVGAVGQFLRMRALGREGTEFHALRDYAEGDDLRQIHWRASARSETLKVRQVEPDGLRRCTVALDTTTSEYTAESFERAVSAAASAIASAAHSALALRLIVGLAHDLRNTTANTAMNVLADCQVGGAGQQMPFAGPGGEGLGLYIVVSGSPDSAAVVEARRQLGQNDVLIVIACTSVGAAGGPFVIDCTDEARFAHSWVSVTGGRVIAETRYAS